MTGLKYLIGTGGALTRLPSYNEILLKLRDMNSQKKYLYPKPGEAQVLIDHHYIMASLGVLSQSYPEAAIELMMQSFVDEPQKQ